jgi:hypothetical protein
VAGQQTHAHAPTHAQWGRAGLLTPSAFADARHMLHYDYQTIDLEISYIHYLRLIAVAVNDMFKQEVMDQISDLLVGGQV